MGIGMRAIYHEHDLKPGQCISNEPGYYKDGHWGIRIESLILIKEIQTKHQFGGNWLGAERITMAPIQTKLVNKHIMTPKQIKWLNDYNAEVHEKLLPLLRNDKRALDWLEKECAAI
jgi:Xaa-Pro aminopeptidase